VLAHAGLVVSAAECSLVVPMNSPENFDDARALEISRKCAASRLPSQAHPEDDDDLVKTGALDSMGWVDVLISIEAATGLQDFGSSWPESRAKSIRSLAEMIREAQSIPLKKNTAERSPAGVGRGFEITVGGWGYALGSVTVDPERIENELHLAPHKIRHGAGIHSLRCADDSEDELVLGQRAAEIALETAAVDVERIDILVATSTTFLGLPSFAASLHSRLLLRENSGALEVGGACAGLIYSLAVAKGLLGAVPQGAALVVASEVHSRRFKNCDVPGEFRGLFGDGSCAFVLSSAPATNPEHALRLGDFVWGCSGNSASLLTVNIDENTGMAVQFKGEPLARAAVVQTDRILEILENKSGRPRAEADYFAVHQPNPRVVEMLAERAHVPLEKIPLISRTCGNLGSATCGVSLCEALSNLRARRDPTRTPLIFMAAVAPGLVWGGTFLS
jgi:3-oxoacyl-[acyl-carrier-protein] synthase III